MRQARKRILDDHHRSIHHEPNRDRKPAQTHEVGRQTNGVHDQERDERRENEGGDDNQA